MEQDGTLGSLSFRRTWRVELTEKHGSFSAVSLRRNKGMDEVGEGRADRKTWGILNCEF